MEQTISHNKRTKENFFKKIYSYERNLLFPRIYFFCLSVPQWNTCPSIYNHDQCLLSSIMMSFLLSYSSFVFFPFAWMTCIFLFLRSIHVIQAKEEKKRNKRRRGTKRRKGLLLLLWNEPKETPLIWITSH